MTQCTKTPLYVVAAHIWDDSLQVSNFMAWQPLPWDDDGYFWTGRQALADILKGFPEYNMPPHQFCFGHREGAAKLIRDMRKRGVNMYDAKIVKIYIKKRRNEP